jgi:hypothetical protein
MSATTDGPRALTERGSLVRLTTDDDDLTEQLEAAEHDRLKFARMAREARRLEDRTGRARYTVSEAGRSMAVRALLRELGR